jgi:hypothetical protein
MVPTFANGDSRPTRGAEPRPTLVDCLSAGSGVSVRPSHLESLMVA